MSWYDDDDYSDIYDPDDDTDYEAEEADEKHMAEFAKTFVKGDCPRCGGKGTVTDSEVCAISATSAISSSAPPSI